MAILETSAGPLYYQVLDVTAPWVAAPETILFHHGVGTNGDVFAGWLAGLAERYRLVRFDVRGLGRSAKPAAEFRYSLDSLMADALAVADAVGASRFHMVGESAGGTVALYTAARRPERLLSMTGVSFSHKGASIDHVREWRRFVETNGMRAWSRQMMERRFHPGALPPEKHAWFEREQDAGDPGVLLALADMLIGADLSALASGIRHPVLMLVPDGSPFVPVKVAAELFSLLPNAEIQVFPHARHSLCLTHGAECAAALAGFLQRRRAATGVAAAAP
ncbi:MAG: alpha/beta fold hydrolase [Alphaproteobacteria bacterium]|nr:alpha/beta fold hydrolase [Alphaproteobacteria bacterium]